MNDHLQQDHRPADPLFQNVSVFGEVLFDCFPDKKSVLGGAPFNVAWHLRGFGQQPRFISAVGKDDLGNDILQRMSNWDMTREFVQHSPDHATGKVSVQFENGEPHYDIEDNRAYDHISIEPDTIPNFGLEQSLLYHGSLAARHPTSATTLIQLKHHAQCFVDVNLRDPWWQKEHVLALLANGFFVKVNFDELATLAGQALNPHDEAQWMHVGKQFRHDFGIVHLLITRGGDGATLLDPYGEDITVAVPNAQVPVADTVGAGDAFSAVMILAMMHGWPWPIALERAQQFASYIVTQQGATTDNVGVYEGFRSLWHIEEPAHV